MIEAIKKAGFDENNKEHMLISLGDNLDRGRETIKVIEYLNHLINKNKIILIRGNHEDLLEEYLERKYFREYDYVNGTAQTAIELFEYLTNEKLDNKDINKKSPEICKTILDSKILDYTKKMVNFYETDHYVFTHGFIPVKYYWYDYYYDDSWREKETSVWNDARYLNGIELAKTYDITIPGKKMVVGHYHTSYGNIRNKYNWERYKHDYSKMEFTLDLSLFKPYYGDNLIGLDACCAYSHFLNCILLED